MEKATNSFKDAIKTFLDNKAATDELFAPKYAGGGKNVDDCVTYILNTVQKSGCSGFTDSEVYGMALHYYDEATIDIGKAISVDRVVVNHVIELSAEDKKQAHEKALSKYQADLIAGMKEKQPPKKKVETKQKPAPVLQTQTQASLF